MKKRIDGVVRLSRYKEFFFFVVITSLLGAAAGNGKFGWSLILLLAGNWLAVAFAFMINDVEDAPDDALTPSKAIRNPVSARLLSPRLARYASFGVALLALIIYSCLGLIPFLLGLFCLVLGFLYSWRFIRFKTLPFLDIASHCLMLAGLQFLTAFFTFSSNFNQKWIFPFICILSLSIYGELFNELRDFEGDIKAGLTHTAAFLGEQLSHFLMLICGVIGIATAILTIAIDGLIPLWVVILLVVFISILVIPRMIRMKRIKSSLALQEPFQKPIEIAAAFALFIQFLAPWADRLLPLNAFWIFLSSLVR